jgi:hypothetical protein
MARINAKTEFLNHVGNKIVKCAYIEFIEFEDGDKANLTTGYTQEEYNEFLSILDRDYNNGYGGQELDGMIWYEDGTWTTRGEYDGSEWYEYHEVPEIPDYLNRIDKIRDKKLNNLLN